MQYVLGVKYADDTSSRSEYLSSPPLIIFLQSTPNQQSPITDQADIRDIVLNRHQPLPSTSTTHPSIIPPERLNIRSRMSIHQCPSRKDRLAELVDYQDPTSYSEDRLYVDVFSSP